MQRRYRFALRPTRAQAAALETAIAACAAAFDLAVAEHRTAASRGVPTPSRADLQRRLVPQVRSRPGWAAVSAVAIQQAVGESDRLCRLARSGRGPWPRRRDTTRSGSIHFTKNATKRGFVVLGEGRQGRIRIPRVGDVRAVLHRPLPAEPSSLTVGRDTSGWYASFVVSLPDPEPAPGGDVVGVDLGLRHLASWVRLGEDGASRGRIPNPHLGEDNSPGVVRAKRRLASTTSGSRRHREADRALGRAKASLARRRLDYVRKAVAELLDGDVSAVAIEDLDVRGLHERGGASREALHAAGMSVFIRALVERAEATGVRVVTVNAAFTSMTCPLCGFVRRRRLALSTKTWRCSECGTPLDRDYAAALVIAQHAGLIASGAEEMRNALRDLVAPEGSADS